METHYTDFMTYFYKCIYDLNRYTPSTVLSEALTLFEKVDHAKLIFRTYNLLKDVSLEIRGKCETLFDHQLFLFPSVDISVCWKKLNHAQKDKIWTYLKILMMESDLLVTYKYSPTTPASSSSSSSASTALSVAAPVSTASSVVTKKPLDFNPYVGVGSTDTAQSYSVSELYSALPADEEEGSSGLGLGAIAKLLRLDKMINMQELTDQLKNMTKEDIDVATAGVRDMLGKNMDENTTNLLTDMLSSITTEIANGNMTEFSDIMKIGESIANKMKPQIQEKNIDLTQLRNTIPTFVNQCKDESGNPIFSGDNNPFKLLEQLTGDNMDESKMRDMMNNMGMGGLFAGLMQGKQPPKKKGRK